MEYKGIRLAIDNDGLAIVTMCNRDNKFTMDYVKTWNKVLDDIEKNENITGMITVGEGRAFSTGLDINWLKSQSPTTLDVYHDELHKLYKRIISLGMTTVAVINGHAIAEGAFMALMHDYRIMRKDRGWINWPEVHLKLPFTKTMLDLFRVKVQNGAAVREALVFGKRLDAETAKSLGIVDVTATEENMMSKAKETIKYALGKVSVTRGFFNDMKSDMYNSFVVQEKLAGKL
ncbi:uncharacterized protein LOC132717694 [Ruditapes philippinarum]|uniref:uncharacterized protein LOC132717694 n=1 Tax=Ruditapes philippinarum TaxID=129788 RepID=UPI00295B9674|nr:uncharacterized protein LOC132717694 [Ruditapes philippinarum]